MPTDKDKLDTAIRELRKVLVDAFAVYARMQRRVDELDKLARKVLGRKMK